MENNIDVVPEEFAKAFLSDITFLEVVNIIDGFRVCDNEEWMLAWLWLLWTKEWVGLQGYHSRYAHSLILDDNHKEWIKTIYTHKISKGLKR